MGLESCFIDIHLIQKISISLVFLAKYVKSDTAGLLLNGETSGFLHSGQKLLPVFRFNHD